MPEITSVENIRAKLREFEERMDGAIAAAKALARVKGDAEKLLADLKDISTRSEQSLQKAETVRLQFQQLSHDWEKLKGQIDKAQAESKEAREFLLSELDSAIQSLGGKVAEAEQRIKESNKQSLSEQAELLNRLEHSTRTNAEVVETAKLLVVERAESLNQLLGTIRAELQTEARTKLLHAEELLDSQLKEIEQQIRESLQTTTQNLSESAARNERVLQEKIDSFRDETKRTLSDHQQAIDRRFTDFLNKQNALVQNLSQQIESYNRLSQAQSAELAATNTRLNELASGFSTHKAAVTTELGSLLAGIGELKGLLPAVQTELVAQRQSITGSDSLLRDTSTRLSQMLEKLRQLPLVGNKFK